VNGVVQELIRAQSSSLAPLFDKGAHVYVCGDAKVRRDIER
jgi:sulfite reductase alpha subunit-like flavoprotein